MLSATSRLFTISAALAALVVALLADSTLAVTGYGTASVITNGGFDRLVLSEADSSSVVVAGRDRAADSTPITAPVAVDQASTSSITSTSTSTTSSTVNGVPIVGAVNMTVNGVPVATQNITTSGDNSTSVSVSTSTRCSSSAGCTTTTTTGTPSVLAPMPTPTESATPKPSGLLPDSVRAIAP